MTSDFPEDAFINKKTKRFNTFLFESFLYKISKDYFPQNKLPEENYKFPYEKLKGLELDEDFANASIAGTTNKDTVEKRFERALLLL
jgi:hypothetical protein